MRRLKLIALLLAASTLSGCTAISYYWQAFSGQMEVRRLSRPVEEVLADSNTGPELKRKLAYAARAREFATRELGLPDNRSYRVYADVKRPYVVWNVFAAPELSLDLKTQCFPVAGCVPYRGYFSKADAEAHAAMLRQAGDDVYTGGVPAYSTLGWFDDPLLNTFMHLPDLDIARLIFHELAHQVAYARDDATFNESYAVAVEEEGLRRWMRSEATPAQVAEYERFRLRQKELVALMMRGRASLAAVYAGAGDDAAKRAGKAKVLADLKLAYRQLRAGWNLADGEARAYDAWFERDLNNARLGSVAVYTDSVPAFARMIEEERGNMPAFHARVKALAELPRAERVRQLHQTLPSLR